MKNTSQLKTELFFTQLKEMPIVDTKWRLKRAEAKSFYQQHSDNTSIKDVKEKLRKINSVGKTRVYNLESVAEEISKIQNWEQRVKSGDQELVLEVARAFAPREAEKVTWSQFQNATLFLALHAPNKFVEVNAFIKGLLKGVSAGTEKLKDCLSVIPFDKICDIYQLCQALYDAIEEVSGLPHPSYESISEKLHDFALSASVVLTNPEVLAKGSLAIITGIDALLKAHGLIPLGVPTHAVAELIGKIIGQLLGPSIQKWHNKQLAKLKSHRTKKH